MQNINIEEERKPPKNVWPLIPWKAYIPKDSILMEWLHVMTLPSGICYIAAHIIGFVFCACRPGKTGSQPIVAIAIAWPLSSLLLIGLRFRYLSTLRAKEKDEISLAVLVRFYTATAFVLLFGYSCYILYILYFVLEKPNEFYISCWILTSILGLYFFLRTGTLQERCLKVCFIWPLQTAEDDSKLSIMDYIDQIIWFARLFMMALTIGARGFADEAIRVTIGAGTREETFKLMMIGTLLLIPKYSRNRMAVLYISFAVGFGFEMLENIGYCYHKEDTLLRFINVFGHPTFTFWIAVAIARQRDTLLWWAEFFTGIVLSMGSHALWNFAAHYNIRWLFIINSTITPWIAVVSFMFMKSVYPLKFYKFSDGDERSAEQQVADV